MTAASAFPLSFPHPLIAPREPHMVGELRPLANDHVCDRGHDPPASAKPLDDGSPGCQLDCPS